jgi:hypothetical protein
VDYPAVLADLKERFGDRVLLTPGDLAPLIATSQAVQANMRSKRTFPLPVLKVGRRVGVSIYHLAEYLTYGEVKSVKKSADWPDLKSPLRDQLVVPNGGRGRALDNAWLRALSSQVDFQYDLIKAVRAQLLDMTYPEKSDSRSRAPEGKL